MTLKALKAFKALKALKAFKALNTVQDGKALLYVSAVTCPG